MLKFIIPDIKGISSLLSKLKTNSREKKKLFKNRFNKKKYLSLLELKRGSIL